MRYSKPAAWIGAIAGALLGTLVVAGMSMAQAMAGEVPDPEEIISEVPDAGQPDLPMGRDRLGVPQRQAVHSSGAPAIEAGKSTAASQAIVCIAGCVGPVGSTVYRPAGAIQR